jgi:hypothetical protein
MRQLAMPNSANLRIDANPTKDFFISMLIKDIGATRAIIDLVDNCVDGAKRLRPRGNYAGLTIRIETTKEYFRISDNCGGITVDTAKEYAFRFGRPAQMTPTPHSVGQFGVGMKRALFKLGRKFRIESTTQNSHFVIQEDVDKWKLKKEWEFEFQEVETGLPRTSVHNAGTIIKVWSLHAAIAENFSLDLFKARLAAELAEAHIQSTSKGLELVFNGTPLHHQALSLIQSQRLKPAHKSLSLRDGAKTVSVRIYAGIAESDPSAAGWYVFCNGRLVLSAEQTIVTGWGETREETVPKYHNQFARFRGYIFFDSEDASLLPWNTTKSGVDSDSPRYRSARLEMIKLMRPVIDFLNRLDAEKEIDVTDDKPLEAAIKASKSTELDAITLRSVFTAPAPRIIKIGPQTARIQYARPLAQVRRAQKVLKVRTLGAVGEKTFDYFYKRECED